MKSKRCQLHVEILELENPDEIKNIDLQFKFNRETKKLKVIVKKTEGHTMGRKHTKISTALRDYNEYY